MGTHGSFFTHNYNILGLGNHQNVQCGLEEGGGGEDLKMFVAFKQSWARDNTAATTRPYIQTKQLLLIALCLYSLLVSAALPRFHVDVVAKLKKGRVPSSVFL